MLALALLTHAKTSPASLDMEGETGFCDVTTETDDSDEAVRPAECARRGATSGMWTLDGLWRIWPAQGSDLERCMAACEMCAACRFISFSERYADCSWYSTCQGLRKQAQPTQYVPSHRTWRVKRDGSVLRPVGLPAPSSDPLSCAKSGRGGSDDVAGHMRFMEVGTSDFDTLAGNRAWRGPGLSVEALKMYQDRLPNREGIKKINAAVVGRNASRQGLPFFFVHPANISRYGLPWWIKGCNQIGSPHKEAVTELRKLRLEALMESAVVPTMSFLQLTRGLHALSYLKLDMEGSEAPVLSDVVDSCVGKRRLCPATIVFEHQHLASPICWKEGQPPQSSETGDREGLRLSAALAGAGYVCRLLQPRGQYPSDCQCIHVLTTLQLCPGASSTMPSQPQPQRTRRSSPPPAPPPPPLPSLTSGGVDILGVGHCGITEDSAVKASCDSDWVGVFARTRTVHACVDRCRDCARCSYVSFSERECAWYSRCPQLRLIGGGSAYTSVRVRHAPPDLQKPPPPPDSVLQRSRALDVPSATSASAPGAAAARGGRFAAVCAICNGVDYKRQGGRVQIDRAKELGLSLRRTADASVELVLLTAGFTPEELNPLREVWNRIELVDVSELRFFIRRDIDVSRPWPRSDQVQTWRGDGACTALKLEAFRLTEYDAVACVDSDVCMDENIWPWMKRLHASGAYFSAAMEGDTATLQRGQDGLNTHLMFLTPNLYMHRLLRDKAASGDFTPFTNGEQDVLEHVFPVHGLPRLRPPTHRHGFRGSESCLGRGVFQARFVG